MLNIIKGLQNQVNNLTEMVMLFQKDKFGPSSEKSPKQVDDQLSLFNEVELEADDSIPEPIKKTVKGYVRTGSRKSREELLKDLLVREILCEDAPELTTIVLNDKIHRHKYLHIINPLIA